MIEPDLFEDQEAAYRFLRETSDRTDAEIYQLTKRIDVNKAAKDQKAQF